MVRFSLENVKGNIEGIDECPAKVDQFNSDKPLGQKTTP